MSSLSTPAPIEVAAGYKFAVIAVPESRAGGAPTRRVNLPGGFAVSAGLPTQALETWREDIGRFHIEELTETRLFLWSLTRSDTPEVLDDENEALAKAVYRLYLGLLIAVPYFSHGRLTRLTGGNADDVARARSLSTFDRTYHTLGAPEVELNSGHLHLAADLAVALGQHDESPQNRIVRALRAFRQACEAPDLDLRLHQFVRCAEGFALPPIRQSAKRFAERVGQVCAGKRHHHLEEMYWIRSGIEHLHGPYARLKNKSLSRRQQYHRLLMRCVEAETLARFLLTDYLRNPALWSQFESKASIDAFWDLPSSQFRHLWPRRLPLASVVRSFDWAAVRRQEANP